MRNLFMLAAALAGLPASWAQDSRSDSEKAEYQVTAIYDRLTDSTRVTALLIPRSRAFGLGSWVSLDASLAFAGRQPTGRATDVVLTFESFTPSRGGWGFGRPQRLRVRNGGRIKLEVQPAEYLKERGHLFDSGRREALSFRIPGDQFVALTEEPELRLKVGNANVRLNKERMALLRELVRWIGPLPRN